jgi:hypothetical protein
MKQFIEEGNRSQGTLLPASLGGYLADRGYFSREQIKAYEDQGIAPLVPTSPTSNNKAAGLFDKRDFLRDAKKDEYRCPGGERAIYRVTAVEHGPTIHKY